MSTKHLFNTSEGLVAKSLQGFTASNPHLRLDLPNRVVFAAGYEPTKVAVISGGGAGHEPAHLGYTGKGMLSACVSGDVFASPSTKQIEAAIGRVQSFKGTILIVTNYTGDMLHFGLAAEKINAAGKTRVGKVVVGDDVAVGRKGGGLVGRRGMTGTIAVNKITGSAAEAGLSFEKVLSIGQATAANLVTMCVGLTHCHVPGRKDLDEGTMGDSACEIGMGIHNEKGNRTISPIPSPEDLVNEMLSFLLDPSDTDRAYVPFSSSDDVLLLINNMGGLSVLELGAFTHVVLERLRSEYSISPIRIVVGSLMTSLNGSGASITLLNITKAASDADIAAEEILGYLDAPTEATAWPLARSYASYKGDMKQQLVEEEPMEDKPSWDEKEDINVESKLLESGLRMACKYMIESEPQLTIWDTQMGDGDCGTTVANGANGLNAALDDGLAEKGQVLRLISEIVDIVEVNMGGTLGAIFGIFFASFQTSLRALILSSSTRPIPLLLSQAAFQALETLQTYTPARVGDRTVLDVLIPFVHTLEASQGDLSEAAGVAEKAAEGTRRLVPKLGRATYVEIGEGQLPPDPGAWAVWELVRGLRDGLNEAK